MQLPNYLKNASIERLKWFKFSCVELLKSGINNKTVKVYYDLASKRIKEIENKKPMGNK